jgi:hypothetical protein
MVNTQGGDFLRRFARRSSPAALSRRCLGRHGAGEPAVLLGPGTLGRRQSPGHVVGQVVFVGRGRGRASAGRASARGQRRII